MATEETSAEVPLPTHYQFESETQLFEIPMDSDAGRQFQAFESVEAKIQFLKANGKLTIKDMQWKKIGDRIMIHQNGVWVFRNVGQLEYRIFVDSERGIEYITIPATEPEKRREFFERNVERIAEWPDRIVRKQCGWDV